MDKMRLDLSAPHQKYFHADGKQVVGVTTYLGVLAKESLYDWYPRVEREGVREHVLDLANKGSWDETGKGEWLLELKTVEKAFDTLPKWDSGKPRWFGNMQSSKAADLGTIAHAHIEAWLTGRELDPEGLDPALYEQALDPLKRFTDWWESEGMTLVVSEQQLVHEQYRYGGTIDFVARDKDDRLVLGDIKTTKANRSWPYPTVIAQVAAYRALWDDTRSDGKIARCVVVRVGKEATDPGQQVWLSEKALDAGEDLFLAAQQAHRALERLK